MSVETMVSGQIAEMDSNARVEWMRENYLSTLRSVGANADMATGLNANSYMTVLARELYIALTAEEKTKAGV